MENARSYGEMELSQRGGKKIKQRRRRPIVTEKMRRCRRVNVGLLCTRTAHAIVSTCNCTAPLLCFIASGGERKLDFGLGLCIPKRKTPAIWIVTLFDGLMVTSVRQTSYNDPVPGIRYSSGPVLVFGCNSINVWSTLPRKLLQETVVCAWTTVHRNRRWI